MKPLDDWLRKDFNISSRKELDIYIEEKLEEQIFYAKENSDFYRKRLSDAKTFEDIPFLTQEDLRKHGKEMICVRNSKISRIVTSGTTGTPKRVYFTEEDQDQIISFFKNGMKYMTDEGDKAYILFKGDSRGSLVNLLKTALEEIKVTKTEKFDENVKVVIGDPAEVLNLSERYDLNVKSVLLSSSYVSEEVKEKIKKNWNAEVYEHYGMTEMGLGCAVSCGNKGYHIRENDIYIEIIDSKTGKVLEDGEWGEIVFTSLRRKAMPFIRYRTGDISRIINEPCSCGSILKRLDKVKEREDGK